MLNQLLSPNGHLVAARSPAFPQKLQRNWLIDLRKSFDSGDGQLRAGPKGISLSVKHLPDSVAMNEALEVARSRGLIQADEEGFR